MLRLAFYACNRRYGARLAVLVGTSLAGFGPATAASPTIGSCTPAAVIAAGSEEYESVFRDPVRFMPYANDLVSAEALLYVPDNACKHLTGDEWVRSARYSYDSYSNTARWTEA